MGALALTPDEWDPRLDVLSVADLTLLMRVAAKPKGFSFRNSALRTLYILLLVEPREGAWHATADGHRLICSLLGASEEAVA